MSDAAVKAAAALLGLESGEYFDAVLEQAVKGLQAQRGLLPDGEIGIDTWTALLRPKED